MKVFNSLCSCFRAKSPPASASASAAEHTTDMKRKADSGTELAETTMPEPKNRKLVSGLDSAQNKAIADFTSVTQMDKKSAQKFLKTHNWNATAAVNAFFSNPVNNANNPIRTTMNKIFDRYRDDPRNEPDEIGVEGTGNMLGEMGINLDDIGALVFSELVQSPTLGKITREGFVDAAMDTNADSISKLRNIVLQRRTQLKPDRELFKNIYNHTFLLALSQGQKSLGPDEAVEFWRMLFSPAGLEWRTSRTPWLEWWLEFQQTKYKKAINKDLWKQTLNFADQTMKDESLGFWSEESSWPSVIDDFVEWVKTEKRPANGDAMEVE